MSWGHKCSNPACEKEVGYTFIAALSAYSATPANQWSKLAYVCSMECLAQFAQLKVIENSDTAADETINVGYCRHCRWWTEVTLVDCIDPRQHKCDRLEASDALVNIESDPELVDAYHRGYAALMVTAQDFGCIQFAPKEANNG